MQILSGNHKYVAREHFQDLLQNTCQRLNQLDCSQNQADSYKASKQHGCCKHMRNQPASQLEAQLNQLQHQKVYLAQPTKKGKKRKLPYLADQKWPGVGQLKQGSTPPVKKLFKQQQAAIRFTTKKIQLL